ncbi:MAG TPA: DNA mismatch repair protein MutS [Spirochaetia bacterium]|nr:DNA mismatch repair protein MutS [Spirochaetia bacterium]
MTDTTPMMRQYAQIKREHGDAILFFRLGDFYEMFRADAEEASRILNLTLTQRNGVPMCGIPYHASHNYIGRLLRAGKKIAICEQIKLPPGGKGLADRQVIEVVTPGTVTEEDYLETGTNNYLLSVGRHDKGISVAWIDLSTGELYAGEVSAKTANGAGTATDSVAAADAGEGLRRHLARVRPREILVQESLLEEDAAVGRILGEQNEVVVNRFPDWSFDQISGRERLKQLLSVTSLKGYGLADDSPCLAACGVLIQYVEDTARSLLTHVRSIKFERESDFVALDESTQKNLELVQNLNDGGKKFTLLMVIDQTKTAMGARLLKRWLLAPLLDPHQILDRQKVVEALYRDQMTLGELRSRLSTILDIERLCSRVALDKAHGKDLASIAAALARVLDVAALLEVSRNTDATLEISEDEKAQIVFVRDLIDQAIVDNPSVVLTEGNLIRPGYNPELDSLRGLRDNSRAVLDEYLSQERRSSGISNLRIRYNRIIGHYLEVSKSNVGLVPEHFIRRQSLVGGDRFTTQRLGEIESELNSASERITDLERELFIEVRGRIRQHTGTILDVGARIAQMDCLQSFAYAATLHGYVRPIIEETGGLHIRGGRHPVVEAYLPAGSFVPNDLVLGADGENFALITGPNMAGKSTFLRQTALIVLMAQIGAFVPAEEAKLSVVDKIFCRVGASDNLARGESTFLVEMNETAFILRTATARSLIIMDEVGRGTGTNDGLAIAWAVTEHIIQQLQCRTLFATHYHELTALDYQGMFNLSLAVRERNGEIVFLKKVQRGPSSNSYGIQVARLAGLPESVIARGQMLLARLQEAREVDPTLRDPPAAEDARPKGAREAEESVTSQPGLWDNGDLVIREILSTDIARLSPLDALNRLARWQKELQ